MPSLASKFTVLDVWAVSVHRPTPTNLTPVPLAVQTPAVDEVTEDDPSLFVVTDATKLLPYTGDSGMSLIVGGLGGPRATLKLSQELVDET